MASLLATKPPRLTFSPSGIPVVLSPSRSRKPAAPAVSGLGRVPDVQDLLKRTLGQGRAPVTFNQTSGVFETANPFGDRPVPVTDLPEVKAAETLRDVTIRNAADKARQDVLSRLIASGDPSFAGGLQSGDLRRMALQRGFSEDAIRAASDILSLSPEQQNLIRAGYGTEAELGAREARISGRNVESDPALAQAAAVLRDIGPSGYGARAQFERSAAQAARSIGGALAARNMFRSGEAPYLQRESGIARNIAEQNYVANLLSGLSEAISGRVAANAAAEKAYQQALSTALTAVAANPKAYPEAQSRTAQTVIPPAPVRLMSDEERQKAIRAAASRVNPVLLQRNLRAALGGRR